MITDTPNTTLLFFIFLPPSFILFLNAISSSNNFYVLHLRFIDLGFTLEKRNEATQLTFTQDKSLLQQL